MAKHPGVVTARCRTAYRRRAGARGIRRCPAAWSRKGDTLLIIEAMKTMNQFLAAPGTVTPDLVRGCAGRSNMANRL